MAIPTPVEYWKFDETSGNATGSVSSTVLTNNNTVSYTTGNLNNGADFGSSNANKTFTSSSTLGIAVNGAKSFAGWVKVATNPGAYDIMGMGYNANSVFYVIEYIDFGGGTLRLRVGRGRNGVDDPTLLYTTTLTTGTWFHLAYTFDASYNQELYVNGTSVVANTATSGNGSGGAFDGVVFSRALYGAARFYSGMVDEWGIWNVELTASEVSELYNSGTPPSYPFGGGGGGGNTSNFFALMT